MAQTKIERSALIVPIAGDRAESLIAKYVRKDPHRPGLDRARVVADDATVPVWALIGHLRGEEDITSTAAAYDLPEEAVLAAVAYYQRNQIVIDHRLSINDGLC